jgi:hypothetical protein
VFTFVVGIVVVVVLVVLVIIVVVVVVVAVVVVIIVIVEVIVVVVIIYVRNHCFVLFWLKIGRLGVKWLSQGPFASTISCATIC